MKPPGKLSISSEIEWKKRKRFLSTKQTVTYLISYYLGIWFYLLFREFQLSLFDFKVKVKKALNLSIASNYILFLGSYKKLLELLLHVPR